jgi:hypothetical protein
MGQTLQGWRIRVELDGKEKGHWVGPAGGVSAVVRSKRRGKKRKR